jgi:hypothetical protein
MSGMTAHVARRDAQPSFQNDLVRTKYAEAFRTDMIVGAAISALAVLMAAVTCWQRSNRPPSPLPKA